MNKPINELTDQELQNAHNDLKGQLLTIQLDIVEGEIARRANIPPEIPKDEAKVE